MGVGGKYTLGAVLACLSACSTTSGKLEIRPKSTAGHVTTASLAEYLATAHSNLSLGNVGLALELFRKAQREAPQSVDALGGLATCYDRMGRYDLSRRYFEAALAVAPGNTHLLGLFEASLERQGARAEAAAVRAEIALRKRGGALVGPVDPAMQIAADEPLNEDFPTASSVIVPLPTAKPLAELPTTAASLLSPAGQPNIRNHNSAETKPRLERVSLAEVVLRTIPQSQRTGVEDNQPSTNIRFVALKRYPAPAAGVRLLNAARAEGLASRTRSYLLERGWRGISVGDAEDVRQTSVIYFPEARRRTAESLAAQFNIRVGRQVRGDGIVMVLGRDAAQPKFLG